LGTRIYQRHGSPSKAKEIPIVIPAQAEIQTALNRIEEHPKNPSADLIQVG
jgi:hypothetical protein